MLGVLLLHFALAAVLPALARRIGRAAFGIAALAPATAFATVVAAIPATADGGERVETLAWAPDLGLELAWRADALSLVLALLVSGIGVVVLGYFVSYAAEESGHGRNAGLMTAFAGAMLGLVLADDVFGLYLFWELTTLCSFGLIGGAGAAAKQRRAALQGLLVTTLGGFALLVGLIILAHAAGSFRISTIVAAAPEGTVASTGLALVLLGAITKSAQLPFHRWLPAAMVAPTPVSAYLHAAAMVKAGVYLVARIAPAYAEHALLSAVMALGLVTMIAAGYRALRQHDLKELLAYSTISQLGFLLALFAAGTHTAALAGMTMVLAHGLCKATLFLVAGVVDKTAGTRDMRELSGLCRRWPLLAATATLAGASMVGLPPLLGFVGKEAAFEGFLSGGPADTVTLAGIVAGSAVTVAYTLRLLLGTFGTTPDVPSVPHRPPAGTFVAPAAITAVAGLALGPVAAQLGTLFEPHASALPMHKEFTLELWHGLTPALGVSALTLAAGYALYRLPTLRPLPGDAQLGYENVVHGVDATSRFVTGRTQLGSLPAYLGVILLAVAAVPAAGYLLGGAGFDGVRAVDSTLQVPFAVLIAVATASLLVLRRRLAAVVVVGAVGYAVGALFLIHGATDLALAQVLVESLTLIVFVLVLRRLPATFTRDRPSPTLRLVKAAVATLAGGFVALSALALSHARTAPADARAEYLQTAESEAGAANVVNAVLVDFRALDTVGEITVLLVAITGAAGLIVAAHQAVQRIAPPTAADRTGREEDDNA